MLNYTNRNACVKIFLRKFGCYALLKDKKERNLYEEIAKVAALLLSGLLLVSAAIEILMCSFIAYGMARFKARGKGVFNTLLILLILIPSQMIVVPMMMNYSKLDILGIFGLLNKLTGIDLRVNILGTPLTFYLPSLFGVGLRSGVLIYIYIQFFKGLPGELEEAAWIDGAGLFKTFF